MTAEVGAGNHTAYSLPSQEVFPSITKMIPFISSHSSDSILDSTLFSAWNAGKAKALAAATKHVGEGPYFSNGDFFEVVISTKLKKHAQNFLKKRETTSDT